MSKEMVDLKRSKKEKKEQETAWKSPSSDDYGYGQRIHLDHDTLMKLGMKENPEVGSAHEILGHAVVTHESSSNGENGPSRRVEMQLQKMGVKPKDLEEEKPKGKNLRSEIEENATASEEKAGKKDEAAQRAGSAMKTKE